MVRSRRLLLEELEDRCVPATFGNPWPDAPHLTISFVPDGTLVGVQASNLFATLNALEPTAAWQRDILRAFQAWGNVANINFGLVSDDGEALGTPGRPQGDPRFGDIRIAAVNLVNGEEPAFAAPFDPTAGMLSGDIRLTSPAWSGGNYDVYTVMMHEAGHVLGLDHSADPSSVMYQDYLGPRKGLSAGDVSAIQALYGARQPDGYEGSGGNNTMGTASRLQLLADSNGVLSVSAQADLGAGDRDWYSVQAPSVTGGLVVTLQRAGVSLLTPRVTVYNSAGQVVGSAVSSDPLGGDLVIKIGNVVPLADYYVQVQGGSGTSFDVGSYGLQVQSLPVVNSLTNTLTTTLSSTTQSVVNTVPLNSSFLTARSLAVRAAGPNGHYDAGLQATLLSGYSGYYRVTAPDASTGANVLTVMSWAVGRSQLLPRVTVYDAQQNVVTAQTLVNENGAVVLQLTGVTPGASYYVVVSGATQSGTGSAGNYFVGVDFGSTAAQLTTFAGGQLNAQAPSGQGMLYVQRSAVYHWVLSADLNSGTGVQLTIRDSSGRVVGQVTADAGQSVSLTVTLVPGTYTLSVSAYRRDGKPITPVNFLLQGEVLTDPIGPQPDNSTSSTSSSPPPSSSTSGSYSTTSTSTTSSGSYSGSSTSSGTSSDSYYTYNWDGSSSTYGGPSSSDPYSSGYTV